MKPGRELDALIAEKVMGWKCSDRHCDGVVVTHCGACGRDGHSNCYGDGTGQVQTSCENAGHRPEYSTDIAAAWEVVEKFDLLKWERALGKSSDGTWCMLVYSETDGDHHVDLATFGTSAPHAICLAALKAIGASASTTGPIPCRVPCAGGSI